MSIYGSDVVEMPDTSFGDVIKGGSWNEVKNTWIYTDQDGRQFAAMTRVNNRPLPVACGPYSPVGWSPAYPELMPPPQFIKATRTSNRIVIDYAGWLESLRVAESDIDALKQAIAIELYGSAAGDKLAAEDSRVLQALGSLPMSNAFVRAMMQKSKWALGLSSVVPEWVTEERLLTLRSYRERLKKVALRGIDSDEFFGDAPLVGVGEETAARIAVAESHADIEELADPEATGGHVEPVRSGRRRPDNI